MECLGEVSMHERMEETLHPAARATQTRGGMEDALRCHRCVNGIKKIEQSQDNGDNGKADYNLLRSHPLWFITQ